jgi:hypothetical protein
MDRTGTVDTGDDRYQLESPRSPDRQVIPRRFPRIGSQFQTRIGKSTEPLDRRPPDRMSTKYPYATEHEVNRCRDSDFLEMELGDGRYRSLFLTYFPRSIDGTFHMSSMMGVPQTQSTITEKCRSLKPAILEVV